MSKNIINTKKSVKAVINEDKPKNLKEYLLLNTEIMEELKANFNLDIEDPFLKKKITGKRKHFKLLVIKLISYLCFKEINNNEDKLKLTLLLWFLEENNFKHDYKIIYNKDLDINIYNLRNLYNFIMKDESFLLLEIDIKEDKEKNKFNCCCCLEDKEEVNNIICYNCKPEICGECYLNIENNKCPLCRGFLRIRGRDQKKITLHSKEYNIIDINKNDLFTIIYYDEDEEEEHKKIKEMNEIKILSFNEIMAEKLDDIKHLIPFLRSNFLYNNLDFQYADRVTVEYLSHLQNQINENPRYLNDFLNIIGLNKKEKLEEIFISLIEEDGINHILGEYSFIERITIEDTKDTEFYFLSPDYMDDNFEMKGGKKKIEVLDNDNYLTIHI